MLYLYLTVFEKNDTEVDTEVDANDEVQDSASKATRPQGRLVCYS